MWLLRAQLLVVILHYITLHAFVLFVSNSCQLYLTICCRPAIGKALGANVDVLYMLLPGLASRKYLQVKTCPAAHTLHAYGWAARWSEVLRTTELAWMMDVLCSQASYWIITYIFIDRCSLGSGITIKTMQAHAYIPIYGCIYYNNKNQLAYAHIYAC